MLVQLHFQVVIAFAPQTLVLQHLIPSQSQRHSRIPPSSCICLYNHCAMRIPRRPFLLSLSAFSPPLAPLLSSRLRFASGICAKPPRSLANATSPGSFFSPLFRLLPLPNLVFLCSKLFNFSYDLAFVTRSAKSSFVVELAIYL